MSTDSFVFDSLYQTKNNVYDKEDTAEELKAYFQRITIKLSRMCKTIKVAPLFFLPHIYFQNDEINNDVVRVWMIDALHGDFESTSSCSLIKFPEINTKAYLRLLSSLSNELV